MTAADVPVHVSAIAVPLETAVKPLQIAPRLRICEGRGQEVGLRVLGSNARPFHRRMDRAAYERSVHVIESAGRVPSKRVAVESNFKRNLAAADERARRSICRNLDELSDNTTAGDLPGPEARAIARIGVAGVRIRFLHGTVGIENVHLVFERRARHLNEPCTDDRWRGGIRRRYALPRQDANSERESGEYGSFRSEAVHGAPILTTNPRTPH